jgi:type I restriction enzyme S subunit
MSSWPQIALGELCSLITDGKHGDCVNEDGSGYYFISAKDVRDGRIHYEDARQIIQKDFAETHRRTNLTPGDVVLTNSGTIGRLAIASNDDITCRTTFQKSVAVLKPLRDKVLPEYLYYVLVANRSALENAAGGAAQKNLLLGDLRKLQVAVPSIRIQARISTIISKYDDLIANNRRRIQLLEEAARLIYREWFVRLRFPGHEHVKVENGIPEGWKRVKTSDLCDSLGGGTPATGNPAFWHGDIPWVVPSDVTKNRYVFLPSTERQITDAGLRGSSAQMLPPETILMTSRASVGFFALVDKPVCTNQGFINVVPKRPELRMYLLFCLLARVEDIRALAGGSTYPEISKGKFREIGIIEPAKAALEEFDRVTRPLLDQTRVLILQNRRLVQARDLLLPRLMSGEIEV